jgi:hypothetical protein
MRRAGVAIENSRKVQRHVGRTAEATLAVSEAEDTDLSEEVQRL